MKCHRYWPNTEDQPVVYTERLVYAVSATAANYKVLGNQIINSLNPKVRIYNVFSALFSIFFAVVYLCGEFELLNNRTLFC